MIRAHLFLLVLAATSCSEPAKVESRETAAPSAESSSREAGYITGTSEELAFLASRVCVPQVAKSVVTGELENTLTKHGYRLASRDASRELFGRVVNGFVAARKDNEFGRFKIAFGSGLPACAVLLTDDSVVPPVEELRAAFEKQGWEWVYMGAVRPAQLPYAGFTIKDRNGKTILADLENEPSSDREVRLGINISYTNF